MEIYEIYAKLQLQHLLHHGDEAIVKGGIIGAGGIDGADQKKVQPALSIISTIMVAEVLKFYLILISEDLIDDDPMFGYMHALLPR